MNGGGYSPGRERFDVFFANWVVEQERYLHELLGASRDRPVDEGRLRELTSTVVEHYEHYYRTKSRSAKRDVTAMMSPTWTSGLEDALLWVGGWRPSTAFHLLYSKSGVEFESHLDALLLGHLSAAPDVGHLSAAQLAAVDDLHRRTVKEERDISERQAEQQEAIASVTMVDLTHAVTERRVDPATADSEVGSVYRWAESVLQVADELRLRTLKDLVAVLDPIQAVHFLTAAAELHLRLHEWGKKRDRDAAAAAARP